LLSAPSLISRGFQSSVESPIAVATCPTVTTLVADWNHAVPCMPTTSGFALRCAPPHRKIA
jgi:hypothetical protein